jgi:hypothetical protein
MIDLDAIRKNHQAMAASCARPDTGCAALIQAHKDRGTLLELLDGAKVGERVAEIEKRYGVYRCEDIDPNKPSDLAGATVVKLVDIIRGMQARLDADEAALGRVRGVLADWTRPAGLSGTSDRVMICKDLQEALGEFKEGGNG